MKHFSATITLTVVCAAECSYFFSDYVDFREPLIMPVRIFHVALQFLSSAIPLTTFSSSLHPDLHHKHAADHI